MTILHANVLIAYTVFYGPLIHKSAFIFAKIPHKIPQKLELTEFDWIRYTIHVHKYINQ